MKTVGLSKRLILDIGPYFFALSSSHLSAVLALIAQRRLRLWPTRGIPSDPGGSLLDHLFLLLRRKAIGRTIKTRERKKFMVSMFREKGEKMCLTDSPAAYEEASTRLYKSYRRKYDPIN